MAARPDGHGRLHLNAGSGGTYILYGPRTPKDKIPDIRRAKRLVSETSNAFILMRFIQLEDQTPIAELQKKVHIYESGEEPPT